jgi:hypothetical protein
MAGHTIPEFRDLAQLPDWALDADARESVLCVAALLYFRPQIDREINGRKLAQLAEAFGEDQVDLACSAQRLPPTMLAPDSQPLPSPDAIHAIGNSLMERHCEPEVAPLIKQAEAIHLWSSEAA